jgi:diaminohydroxyphosphoribosylaminopyrimidine deaminase/5-amino-6-(5-phosphoribosylamino)uracil reductase
MGPFRTQGSDERFADDLRFMRRAIRLAQRARGGTFPNPLVGAVLTQAGAIIGEGWHQRAGGPHAEIEAFRDAESRTQSTAGATLYVTLEPCCTHGRTPPCTAAIIKAGVRRVVVGTVDPNPAHAGHGLELLRQNGIEVVVGVSEPEAARLNPAFNHWIVRRTPLVTLKSAMTLDGKIATAAGESKWITNEQSRAEVLRLRRDSDAVLVGLNTVLLDDPGLLPAPRHAGPFRRRIVLDSRARTPLTAKLVNDSARAQTIVVVSESAPPRRVAALRQQVHVIVAPVAKSGIDLPWLMRELGRLPLTHLLVEGGGEVHASFLAAGLVHRVAFFYAPKILGGAASRRSVAGAGFTSLGVTPRLVRCRTRRFGSDFLLTGAIPTAPAESA